MNYETRMDDLQADVFGRLNSDPYFSDVTVLTEKKQDIESEIERALGTMAAKAGKSGACVIVLNPIAKIKFPDASEAIFEYEIVVQVTTLPLVNDATGGTGKSASTIATHVVQCLYQFQSAGVCGLLEPVDPVIVPTDEENGVTCLVHFRTLDDSKDLTLKVSTPNASATSDTHPSTVTLSCGTSGAAIYYTTDGSYPSAQNDKATLYTVPLSVTAAATVRFGAYKTGSIGSNINSKIIS